MRAFTILILIAATISNNSPAQKIKFETSVISNSVALHPIIFDVQKDGVNDIVVVDKYVDEKGDDGKNIKTVCWISGSEMAKKNVIYEVNYRSCDMAAADIDNDGFTDIIGRYDTDMNDVNETGGLFWLKNPYGSKKYDGKPWLYTEIGYSSYAKDICTTDFNRDGKTDIISRGADHKLYIYIQVSPKKWDLIRFDVPGHDGTDIGDINKDGIPDIAINGLWIEAPADLKNGEWKKHDFAPRWYTQKTGPKGMWFDNNTKVSLSDMDDDGWLDIIVAMAENTGYQICWYRNPGSLTNENWEEYEIGFMNYCHTLEIADMDNDGDKDIVAGELIIYNSPVPDGYHPVVVFINKGNSLGWERQVIGENACYGGTTGDIDMDGDMDIVAPRNWNRGPLYLWRNMTDKVLTLSSVRIAETVVQNIPAFRIETPSATYIYDKAGGGFISMIDKNGNDWISFKDTEFDPPGNAASRYRGIPNLGITGADNDAGHPGFNMCETKVIAPNVIETVSKTGNWKFRWAFYDNYAKFIMVKTVPGIPYWFLYEGTPAGKWDPQKMYWGNNLHGRRGDFPDLLGNTGEYNNWDWVYTGQKEYPRILFLKQLQPDEKTDLFSYMGNTREDVRESPDGMVCFGFGRAHKTEPVLNDVNLEFVIGFIEKEVITPEDHQLVSKFIKCIKYCHP